MFSWTLRDDSDAKHRRTEAEATPMFLHIVILLLIFFTINEWQDISQVLIVHERDHFRQKYKTDTGYLPHLDVYASLIMCPSISYQFSSNDGNVLDLVDTIVRRQRTVVDLLPHRYCAFAFRSPYLSSV